MDDSAVNIITLVKLTGQIIVVAYESSWACSEQPPNELQHLLDELQSLGKVLTILRKYTQPSDHTDPNYPLRTTLQLVTRTGGPLSHCSQELETIWLRFCSGEGNGKEPAKPIVAWPWTEKELMLRIERLRKHRNILAQAVHMMDDHM